MQKRWKWFSICFLTVVLLLAGADWGNAYSTITVNVLIHNGTNASSNCVNGTVACLSTSNVSNLIPGVWFTWGFNGTINATTLSGYDVLVMPGGNGFGSGYRVDSNINANDIRTWVASGKGYFGTCAGAYGGSYITYNYAPSTTSILYYAWGVAPHINALAVSYNGNLTLSMTSAGQYTLNYSGIQTLDHESGPAMKANSPGAIVFATYADSNTGYPGHIAIVGDTYGSGRTILCGPHPELTSPRKSEMVARMAAWAGKAIDTQIPIELVDFDAVIE
ncbi:MAG: hypothetical protein ACE14V_07370 [bacterium]